MQRPSTLARWGFAIALCLLQAPVASAQTRWWTPENGSMARPVLALEQAPLVYQTYRIDAGAFRRAVAAAPHWSVGLERGVELELPRPDGDSLRLRVVESPILSEAMQAHRPDIRTYLGVGIDDPRVRVRFGIAGEEFHARVRDLEGSGYTISTMIGIEPSLVLAWFDEDRAPLRFECFTDAEPSDLEFTDGDEALPRRLGNVLRTYRLAFSATGELTTLAGSVAATENLITGVVNLVNGVYENELAVTFQIVDFNVYSNPATDPYTNGTDLDGLLIDQNNSALNAKLGASNYDVGHVIGYTPGSGTYGLAYVSAQCRTITQGGGGTFSGGPTTGALADVVLHELGHQVGATHSFNSVVGGCSGNRSAGSAYEIGSGITIMSYAGLCGSDNLSNVDFDVFNAGALNQITNRINSTQSCGSTLATGNLVPSVDAGPDVTIPRGTAFVLSGSANDPDGDPLTYSWEQYDLGAASPPGDPVSSPLFRNFLPSSSPVRSLPIYSLYRRSVATPFESLPSVDRTMSWRLVVRDNDPVSGATAWDTKGIIVSGDPFAITSPNGGESFAAGAPVTLTWNVGGGSVASDVRVLSSTDEGVSWTEVVASTPNDGSVEVPAPCAVTSGGRFRLEAIGNIFFDLSNQNFAVTAETIPPVFECPASVTFVTSDPNGLPKTDAQVQDFIANLVVTDNCDTEPTKNYVGPDVLPLGASNILITAVDEFNNLAVCVVPVTVEQSTSAPTVLRTELVGAVPNPFNPRTTIEFGLARAQDARLEVIDVRGRRVTVLADGRREAGPHAIVWDGTDGQGARVPSGVYFLRLSTSRDGEFTSRLTLLE